MPLIGGILTVMFHLTIGLLLAPFTGGASLVATPLAVNIDMNQKSRRSRARRRRR